MSQHHHCPPKGALSEGGTQQRGTPAASSSFHQSSPAQQQQQLRYSVAQPQTPAQGQPTTTVPLAVAATPPPPPPPSQQAGTMSQDPYQPPGQYSSTSPRQRQEEAATATTTTERTDAATVHSNPTTTTPGLKGTFQNLSSRLSTRLPLPTTTPTADNDNTPNVGFTPTPAMIKRHYQQQQQQQSGMTSSSSTTSCRRPLYQFQVTKLRSWRTGYVRLLCLYGGDDSNNNNTFCTIDPESHQITNTWNYTALTDWLAIPNNKEDDCILLQVSGGTGGSTDKLKLKCHNVHRSHVLTALLECKYKCCERTTISSSSVVGSSKTGGNNDDDDNFPLFKTCQRLTRHGTRVLVSLKVVPHGLLEVHPTTHMVLQTYRYIDIVAVSFTSDDTAGICFHMSTSYHKTRIYFVESSRKGGNGRSDVLTCMREQCTALGLQLRIRGSCTVSSWLEKRRRITMGGQGGQQRMMMGPIVSTWDVSKSTRRHDAAFVGHEHGWMRGIVSRRLAITGRGFLLEMDATGVVSCQRLVDLHALVRPTHADTLTVEYKNGTSRTYASVNRDALLVSLLDAANYLANNASVHVSDVTSGGYCLSSLDTPVEAPSSSSTAGIIFQTISIPQYCLKRLHAVSTAAFAFLSQGKESSLREGEPMQIGEECRIVVEACREFNGSVPPTAEGLPVAATDRFILGSVGALWGILSRLLQRPSDSGKNIRDWHEAELAATPMFQALYRLSQTPAGYRGTADLNTMQDCIGLLWQLDDSFCQFWMLRVLRALLSGPANKRDKEVEFVNKSVILRTGGSTMIDGLVSTMLNAGLTQPGGQKVVSDLILFVAIDILQSVLCSNHDTTNPDHFSAFIKVLANGHRALLTALQSPTSFVIENTALLLHLLATHDPQTSTAIREAALGSGILLQHFHAAIFSPMEGQRFLSRYLCSLWLSGPMECDEKRLLKRMVPSGFIGYLKMPILSRMEEEQLDELERDAVLAAQKSAPVDDADDKDGLAASGAAGTNTARLRSRVALAVESSGGDVGPGPENFRIFFHVLTKDHALADLIWNQQTRQELRMALENEIQSIKRATETRGGIDRIAWNHQQFAVEYPSLENEVKVGTVYMRLWLQAGDAFIKSWEEPYRLFELLFRRFLCELDRNSTVSIMCIRCLERLYAIHADKIGPFTDILILVRSMAATKNTETQHRLLGLVSTLLGVSADEDRHGRISIPENAEQLLNIESIGQLCQFVAWGHTNDEQVGNLLSAMLVQSERQKRMISDGSRLGGPNGHTTEASKSNEELESVAENMCPPVWFVSSNRRTPPPTETVKGPFRVSELMSMMQAGELGPYDQVTASHVEDYNEDDDEHESNGSTVKDAHVDTGKWRSINQVWQLRWQLCSDKSSNGIYSPSEVALLALKALTRLVDLHRSLDSRGVPYFPVPFAKRLLCGLSRDITSSASVTCAIDIDQGDSFLSILSQALLCNDHRVVATGAELLHKLMLHNEDAVSKFYLTGVYFFALHYTGNNFRPMAGLLHETHLRQHFRSGFAATASDSELPLKDRSILGNMLPEGLLFILVNYGVERFTEIFVGNSDTPEVIWNLEMRKHLVEMIRQHLGDFPRRLRQNTTSRYEYCPVPGIAYQRLDDEIFCHNYYLRNLCDEARFPNWPIAEPVEVFRACLEEWKRQLRRDVVKEEDAQEEARVVLSLKTGDGSKELRKSYRTLARKYHPDKNPGGREMFETIQGAYELLLPLVDGGGTIVAKLSPTQNGKDAVDSDVPNDTFDGIGGGRAQMQTMHLLIKTQLLICRRYAADMSKYKYPAYQMLLGCLETPLSCRDLDMDGVETVSSACLLMKERAQFVQTASDLVYHTCLVSPLNAEELIAEGGVPILEFLLNFYVSAACIVCDTTLMSDLPDEKSNLIASEHLLMNIISNLVHTISGVAFYESGRSAILALEDSSRLAVNWRRCTECIFKGTASKVDGTSAIKRFSLEGLSNMAKNRELQDLLVGSGVVWPLLRYMLAFDPTLEGAFDHHAEETEVSQATDNEIGRLAARALGMLSGVMVDSALATPDNKELQHALERLLTTPIAKMLRNKRTSEILRTLNANIETPVRIWNVSMRSELGDFVSRMEEERPEDSYRTPSDELSAAMSSFEYSVLKDEIAIGGVYLRVFNSLCGREGLREISDGSLFASEIISFIALCMNESGEMQERWTKLDDATIAPLSTDVETSNVSISSAQFTMAVTALSNLVRIDGLLDDVVSDTSRQPTTVLLSLLELPRDVETFSMCCDLLTVLSPKQSFADAVAEQGSLWRLLHVLERRDETDSETSSDFVSDSASDRIQRGWALLESLSSSSSIARQLVYRSGWLELLGIIAGYESFTKRFASRLGAAKTLSRLLWDTNIGPTTVSLLERFLPPSLIVVLKEEGPDTLLKLFDKDSETPEVIWNGDMRAVLRDSLAEQLGSIVKGRIEPRPESREFQLSSTAGAKYRDLDDELYIGGVYVRLFLKEPTFNLRDPTGFLEKLMIRWTHELEVYVSSAKSSNEIHDGSASHGTVTEARQDALQLVTSASVCLCKVRDSLCEKLAQWGYMTKGLVLMREALACELLGAPLLSIVRIFHVASNCRVNVEALALAGGGGEKSGVVYYIMEAIGKDPLHRDTAVMVEVLLKVYRNALGDVENVSKGANASSVNQNDPSSLPPSTTSERSLQGSAPDEYDSLSNGKYAMAPSPAPGLDPVGESGGKSKIDHPLAFGGQAVHYHSYGASGRGAAQTSGSHRQPLHQRILPSSSTGSPDMSHGSDHPLAMTMGTSTQSANGRSLEQIEHGNQRMPSGHESSVPPQRVSHRGQSPQLPQSSLNASTTQTSVPHGHHQVASTPQVVANPLIAQPSSQTETYLSKSASTKQSHMHQSQSPRSLPVGFTYSQRSQMQQAQGSITGQSWYSPTRKQPLQQAPIQYGAQMFSSEHHNVGQTPHHAAPTRPISGTHQAMPQQRDKMLSSSQQQASVGQLPFQSMPSRPSPSTRQQGIVPADSQTVPTSNQPTPQPLASDASLQAAGTTFQQKGQNQIQVGQPPFDPSPAQPTLDKSDPMPTAQTMPRQYKDKVFGQDAAEAIAQQSMSSPVSAPAPQYRPTPVEGTGIDARSAASPNEKAEQLIMSSRGAPDSAQGRIALLQSALACELPKFLIDDVLENPCLKSIKDPAAAKVHSVELLKLLTMDPGYGLKFKLVLDEIPAWKKYKSQDHSLFITGGEQMTDYFLTDGVDNEPAKLLTEG